jgi:hypothetical protein
MTVPQPPTPSMLISRQFVLIALAEIPLMAGIVLFFFIEPQTTLTIVLAAIAFAIGLVAAVYAIYRAVQLMSEPTTRLVAYVTIASIIGGPLMVFAVSQLI